jgi:hypothetical protein
MAKQPQRIRVTFDQKIKILEVSLGEGESDINAIIKEHYGEECPIGATALSATAGKLKIAGPVPHSKDESFRRRHPDVTVVIGEDDISDTLKDVKKAKAKFEQALNTPSLNGQATQIENLWDRATEEVKRALLRDPRWIPMMNRNKMITLVN